MAPSLGARLPNGHIFVAKGPLILVYTRNYAIKRAEPWVLPWGKARRVCRPCLSIVGVLPFYPRSNLLARQPRPLMGAIPRSS